MAEEQDGKSYWLKIKSVFKDNATRAVVNSFDTMKRALKNYTMDIITLRGGIFELDREILNLTGTTNVSSEQFQRYGRMFEQIGGSKNDIAGLANTWDNLWSKISQGDADYVQLAQIFGGDTDKAIKDFDFFISRMHQLLATGTKDSRDWYRNLISGLGVSGKSMELLNLSTQEWAHSLALADSYQKINKSHLAVYKEYSRLFTVIKDKLLMGFKYNYTKTLLPAFKEIAKFLNKFADSSGIFKKMGDGLGLKMGQYAKSITSFITDALNSTDFGTIFQSLTSKAGQALNNVGKYFSSPELKSTLKMALQVAESFTSLITGNKFIKMIDTLANIFLFLMNSFIGGFAALIGDKELLAKTSAQTYESLGAHDIAESIRKDYDLDGSSKKVKEKIEKQYQNNGTVLDLNKDSKTKTMESVVGTQNPNKTTTENKGGSTITLNLNGKFNEDRVDINLSPTGNLLGIKTNAYNMANTPT